jgi:ubiquitin thioesterase OTU1
VRAVLMLRVRIPNDNSCLFTAIDYLINSQHRPNAANELRELCAQAIISNSDKFNELYLSKEPNEYCSWLLLDTSWGGEVEISILSEIQNICICVIPLDNLRPLRYSPPSPRGAIFLLYTGQHYDAIISESSLETIFPFHSEDQLSCFEALAVECCRVEKEKWEKELKTRTRKKIKCNGCGAILDNGFEFQTHCAEVEHSEDFCYECDEIEVIEMVENALDD